MNLVETAVRGVLKITLRISGREIERMIEYDSKLL